MAARKLIVTRVVTPQECDWLRITYWPGDEIYEFNGRTFGCIDWAKGIAASAEPDPRSEFFEFPLDAYEVA